MIDHTVFDSFPELNTNRLFLREISQEDAEAIFDYFSMDIVTEYYDLETFDEIIEAKQLIKAFRHRYLENKAIRWGIVLKGENRLIGTCGFHSIEFEHDKLEIGYELHPTYWKRGIMTEAITAIIKIGFESMNANRIEAFYDPDNVASEQLLKKVGFQKEGVLRERFFEKGQYVDATVASYLRRDYKNNRLKEVAF